MEPRMSDLSAQLAVAQWRKSSRSQASNCIEAATLGSGDAPVAIRDSKDPGGPVLIVDRQQWTRFVAGTIRGAFRRD
jgi:Domain of unknown function (DUF397)